MNNGDCTIALSLIPYNNFPLKWKCMEYCYDLKHLPASAEYIIYLTVMDETANSLTYFLVHDTRLCEVQVQCTELHCTLHSENCTRQNPFYTLHITGCKLQAAHYTLANMIIYICFSGLLK